MLAAELIDRPRHRADRDRPAPGDQRRELLHESPPRTRALPTPPDALPPEDPNPRRSRHVVQHPRPASTTNRDHATVRAAGRPRRRRDRHDHHPPETLNMLNPHPLKAEQHVAAGTRNSGRARGSAPRTMVRHVEVLESDQRVCASDPRGPRPLPARTHPASLTPTGCPKSQIIRPDAERTRATRLT